MGMKALTDLREMLCVELEEIANKGTMSSGDLETAHKLTDTIKNIDKIEMLEGDDGYSRAWEDENSYGNYNRGNNRYNRYGRGVYSGRSGNGVYSRTSGHDDLIEQLEELMNNATAKDKEAIRKALNEIKR